MSEGRGSCHLLSLPGSSFSLKRSQLAWWDGSIDKWTLLFFPSSTSPRLPKVAERGWEDTSSVELIRTAGESSNFPTELVCALIWFNPEWAPGLGDRREERVCEGSRLAKEMTTRTAQPR